MANVIIKAIIIIGIVWVFLKTAIVLLQKLYHGIETIFASLFVMNGMIMLRHDALSECKSGKTTTKLQFT